MVECSTEWTKESHDDCIFFFFILFSPFFSTQENAELLTEEGRLLQGIQGDDVVDYDIDAYAQRLQEILDRKAELITVLQSKLTGFRRQLAEEESASRKAPHMPQY